jgi:hypothetical protein
MKTIHTILPIYDSLEKQDQARTGTRMPVLTPRFRLPSLLWNVETDDPGELTYIELVDCNGNEIEIGLNATNVFETSKWLLTSISNGNYDSFSSPNFNQADCAKTTSAGAQYCYTNSMSIVSGDIIEINYTITLNSGSSPEIVIVNNSGTDISNVVKLTSASSPIIILKATATNPAARIRVRNLDTELSNFSLVFLPIKTVVPCLYTPLTNDYFQYKGNTLGRLLPRGTFYLKMKSVNGYFYYSDKFTVADIYENLISSLTNSSYGTFVSNGTTIVSAIGVGAGRMAYSSSFSVRKGESLKVIFFHDLSSGAQVTIYLYSASLVIAISNIVTTVTGLNEITLTVTANATDARLYITTTANTTFSMSEILVIRNYSLNFVKLAFNDTHDLNDILYHDGFIQTCFFETRLNNPTHEVEEVGEEKNGIWIAEKIITKYKYRIIANVGRELYQALLRLPQHDTITITDEVGNVYTPKVGNIWVSQPNWIYYDICRLEIQFNDNEEFIWTSENNNIT